MSKHHRGEGAMTEATIKHPFIDWKNLHWDALSQIVTQARAELDRRQAEAANISAEADRVRAQMMAEGGWPRRPS